MPRNATLPTLGLLFLFTAPAAAEDRDTVADDRELLRGAGLASDGPALLTSFRQRTLTDTDRPRIQALIRQLGDDDFAVREKASAALVRAGPSARPLLHEAARHEDREVAWRALQCLQQIDKLSTPALLGAAARLLAHHRPAGSAEALLAFLAHAEEAGVTDEVCSCLAAVARRGGRLEPALVRALGDKRALQRAAAGEVLCRVGGAEHRAAVRKLLRDPEPTVRLRVALALVAAQDKDAVPVLIALLTELPLEQTWRVEELLYRIAGERAPEVALGTDDETRKKCRGAWEAWYKEHGAGLDLAKVEAGRLSHGLTLVTQMDLRGSTGGVLAVDRAGKVIWRIDRLMYPMDAQVLPGDRVLISEYSSRKVSERTFKGEVKWEKTFPGLLLSAQRLPNGHTFVCMRNQLLELDRAGNAVLTLHRPNDVISARKTRDGHVALLTIQGRFLHLDSSGKEVQGFSVGGNPLATGGNFDLLPGGRVLVALYSQSRVVEFDRTGKVLWQANVRLPCSVSRLPNGHTLVCTRTPGSVIELDRNGKEVWSFKPDGRAVRAERR
jgi:hypothetical protein